MPTPITGQIRVGLIGAGLIGQLHSMMLRYVADRTEQSVRVVSVADLSHPAAEHLQSVSAGVLRSCSLRDPALSAPGPVAAREGLRWELSFRSGSADPAFLPALPKRIVARCARKSESAAR